MEPRCFLKSRRTESGRDSGDSFTSCRPCLCWCCQDKDETDQFNTDRLLWSVSNMLKKKVSIYHWLLQKLLQALSHLLNFSHRQSQGFQRCELLLSLATEPEFDLEGEGICSLLISIDYQQTAAQMLMSGVKQFKLTCCVCSSNLRTSSRLSSCFWDLLERITSLWTSSSTWLYSAFNISTASLEETKKTHTHLMKSEFHYPYTDPCHVHLVCSTCSFHSHRPLLSWCGRGQCLPLDVVCSDGCHLAQTSWGASAFPSPLTPPEVNTHNNKWKTIEWTVDGDTHECFWPQQAQRSQHLAIKTNCLLQWGGKRPAESYCVSVETHKSEGQTAYRRLGLTSEVFRLLLLLIVLMDAWREEMAALQLLAKGSIFCEWDRKRWREFIAASSVKASEITKACCHSSPNR